jgi:hypothetical protein
VVKVIKDLRGKFLEPGTSVCGLFSRISSQKVPTLPTRKNITIALSFPVITL